MKVFINNCFIAGLENKENLVTWTIKSTKLFPYAGKNRPLRQRQSTKASCRAVQRQLISVMAKGEQCANKWKKLQEKHKKVKKHSPRTGKEKKNCEFEHELEEFLRSDPNIIPSVTDSLLTTASAGATSTGEDEESSLAKVVPTKKTNSGGSLRPRRSSNSSRNLRKRSRKKNNGGATFLKLKDAWRENGYYVSIPWHSVKEGSLDETD